MRTTLLSGRERREVHWLYIPHAGVNAGLAYALEIRPQNNASRITAYGIFDTSLLRIPETNSVDEHNRQVKDAWNYLTQSSETREWLADIHALVSKGIKRVMAHRDHGW